MLLFLVVNITNTMATALSKKLVVRLKKAEAERVSTLKDSSNLISESTSAANAIVQTTLSTYFADTLKSKTLQGAARTRNVITDIRAFFNDILINDFCEDLLEKSPWLREKSHMTSRQVLISDGRVMEGNGLRISLVGDYEPGFITITMRGSEDDILPHAKGLDRYLEKLQIFCWSNRLPVFVSASLSVNTKSKPRLMNRRRFGVIKSFLANLGIGVQLSIQFGFRYQYLKFHPDLVDGALDRSKFKWPKRLQEIGDNGWDALSRKALSNTTKQSLTIPLTWLTPSELQEYGILEGSLDNADENGNFRAVYLDTIPFSRNPIWSENASLIHSKFRMARFFTNAQYLTPAHELTKLGEEIADLGYAEYGVSGAGALMTIDSVHRIISTLSRLTLSDTVDKFLPEGLSE